MAVKKKIDEIRFEDALASLEKIVNEMESAELPLDEVLQKYEKGIELSHFCTKKLTEAEGKIEFLAKKNAAGDIPTIPFQAASGGDETVDTNSDINEKDSLF
ncbi:MAG: exodeoxyribonuclease VII small subunit [Verrucomicrobiota bacterium]|nr:exodeoxyribonuclease VII small subunit [Verrucomicrobiota bacterium]